MEKNMKNTMEDGYRLTQTALQLALENSPTLCGFVSWEVCRGYSPT